MSSFCNLKHVLFQLLPQNPSLFLSRSKMSSSSLHRRLQKLFHLPHSKPNISKSAAAATAAVAIPPTAEIRLRKVVDKFIKSSESERFRTKYDHYESTVRRLVAHKQFSMVEDLIQSQKKYVDITQEGFAIRLILLYGKAGMFTNARKLFDELPELNCDRTVKSFNALLASCIKAKEYDQVESVFRDVPLEVSIEPDVISYNTVIHAYCEMGALDKAVLFLAHMEKEGMEPNLVTFNTLLCAYYKKGQFLDGENVWRMMESKNIAHNPVSYNARLQGLIQEKRLDEGVEFVAEMEEKEMNPSLPSLNALIKGFCEDGNLEEAKNSYYKILTPNGFTYSTLVPLLCEQGDFDMALELCKQATDNRVGIHTALVQRVVDGLVEASKIEEAKDLVELCNSYKYLHYKLELPQTSS